MECRSWFVPDARAGETQCVCGADCRRERRGRQARTRRRADLEGHRADERKRQARWRRERREAPLHAECHAPASVGKTPEVLRKILERWDKAAALSRASLLRETRAILVGLLHSDGTKEAAVTPLSRAGMPP